MRTFLLSWAAFLALALPAKGQMPPCPKAERAATEAKATQAELLKVQVETMGAGTSLPDSAATILHFKDRLVHASDAVIRCVSASRSDTDPAHVQQMLTLLLGANKPEPPSKPWTGSESDTMPGVLGSSLKVSVKRPNGIANLIAVELQFDIVCGYDTVLLVYERGSAGWQLALIWQRERYESPEKAFGDFFTYAVLPEAGGTGAWRMVVAHGRPWCTSRFSGFNIDLLQPKRGQIQQRTVWHYDGGYSRFDSDPHIEIKPDGFELRVPIWSLDSAVYTLPGVFRFRVAGDKVQREQPVAVNGRDFLNVWLDIDWADAEQWGEAANLDALKAVHDKFAARYANAKDPTTYSYGPVLACGDKLHFQVEIGSNPGIPTYYQIRQEQDGFTMLSASTKSDARCGGHDLMSKQK